MKRVQTLTKEGADKKAIAEAYDEASITISQAHLSRTQLRRKSLAMACIVVCIAYISFECA